MKKLGLIGELITLVAVLAVAFSSCPRGDNGYCVVSGCPRESAGGSDYCYSHKCDNVNCTNGGEVRFSGGMFCSECASRAID